MAAPRLVLGTQSVSHLYSPWSQADGSSGQAGAPAGDTCVDEGVVNPTPSGSPSPQMGRGTSRNPQGWSLINRLQDQEQPAEHDSWAAISGSV